MTTPDLRQDLTVEIQFDGTNWTDVTADLLSQALDISYGQDDEQPVASPMTVRLTLDNQSGDYTPDLANGAHYPNVTLGIHARVQIDASTRLEGEVAQWEPSWPFGDLSGADPDTDPGEARVDIEVAGILRRIGNNDSPLAPAPRRYLPGTSPVAYWPLTGGELTTAGAAAVGRDLAPIGSPGFGAALAPWLDGGVATGFDTQQANALTAGVTGAGFSDEITVDLMVRHTGGTATSVQRPVLAMSGTGAGDDADPRLEWWLLPDPESQTVSLVWNLYWSTSELLLQGGVAATLPADGRAHHVRLHLEQTSGSVITTTISVDGSTAATSTESPFFLVDIPLQAVGRLTIGPTVGNQTLDNVGEYIYGHVAVWYEPEPALSASYTAYSGHSGEHAGRRIERICTEESLSLTTIGDLDDTIALGPQYPDSVLEILAAAARADVGILHEQLTGLGLAYRTGRSLYNQDPALTLDASSGFGQIAPPFVPVLDDQELVNDLTATRRDGGSYQAEVTSGPKSTAAPPAGVGPKRRRVRLDIVSDLDLPNQVGWRLHLGTVPGMRYPSVSPALDVDPSLITAWRALRVGDLIRVTGLPPQHPAGSVDLIARGWQETIRPWSWAATVNTTPESPLRVLEIDRDDYDLLQSDSATLDEALDATETAVDIDCGAGPEWSHEVDFRIVVGGEWMKVTAVGAATGTFPARKQTLTVTRSVNGVTKSHASGAKVLFSNPVYIGL